MMGMCVSRRGFLEGAFAAGLTCGCRNAFVHGGLPKVAVQLYSIRAYLARNGLARTLAEVAALGYEGVEVADYDAARQTCYGVSAAELKRLLAENGLSLCGMHVDRGDLDPATVGSLCAFSQACGNDVLICPGSGNMPPGINWKNHHQCRDVAVPELERHVTELCQFYNVAAVAAAKEGCRVGIHNHQWEFLLKMPDGRTVWDFFFSNTDPSVIMEQDVGWTTAAGYDPCDQYLKYPHRSPTLHAKENGYGCNGTFDGILGIPGREADGRCVKGVDWDRLFPAADADGVRWWIVECERHADSMEAIEPSLEFLRAKGRCRT